MNELLPGQCGQVGRVCERDPLLKTRGICVKIHEENTKCIYLSSCTYFILDIEYESIITYMMFKMDTNPADNTIHVQSLSYFRASSNMVFFSVIKCLRTWPLILYSFYCDVIISSLVLSFHGSKDMRKKIYEL